MDKLKILIVEDEKNLSRTLVQALRMGSDGRYAVEACGTAEMAYALIDSTHYDLVISDLKLPGDDGFSVIKKVKQKSQKTFTILMTGYGSEEVEKQAGLLTEGYLTKPFDVLELVRMVQNVVNRSPKPSVKMLTRDDLAMENSRRILIMEDDIGLRQIYRKALEKSNYVVDEASSLQAARKHLAEQVYEIFICDINMGRARGTDLLVEYKEKLKRKGTHVVICSAHAQYRYLTSELGVDYYLEKPISLGTLLTLVNRLFEPVAHG